MHSGFIGRMNITAPGVRGEVFTSQVRRRKDGPSPLDVPLNGAGEFEIRVKDGGDGRGWDQALWAEAKVLLADGTVISLHDLPMEGNPFGFSFQYHGTGSAELLGRWTRKTEERAQSSNVLRREVTYADPATGLEIRVEVDQFNDWPAVEWVAHLTNRGTANTPVLEDILAMDGFLPVPTTGEATLHWAKGGAASFDDFMPQTTVLKRGDKSFRPRGWSLNSWLMTVE